MKIVGLGLNKAAISAPTPGVQGTLPRNSLRGFGWNELDLTLRRQFPIYESVALQFRADIFNVLNSPKFAPTRSIKLADLARSSFR